MVQAQSAAAQLTALCAVASFVYISHSLERHSLTERPRLSILLVLLLSGCLCFLSSFFLGCIPSVNRYQSLDDGGPDDLSNPPETKTKPKTSAIHMPNRPRKWSIPIVIFCIVLRLEAFHRVNYAQQCSAPGVESFLPLFLLGYEIYSNRRRWVFPVPEDPDDPWRSIFDDLYDWFSGPRVAMVISVLGASVVSLGTYLSTSKINRSTYLCFEPLDSRAEIIALQWAGMALDAAIIVTLWRIIAYTRGIRLRLRTLGTVFVLSSLFMAIVWLAKQLAYISQKPDKSDLAFGSLYAFDALIDGIAFACLAISAIFWICDASPVPPAITMTFLIGMWMSAMHILKFGDWLHLSISDGVLPLWLIIPGTISFTYSYDLRHFLFVRRFLLAAFLSLVLLASTFYATRQHPRVFVKTHPIHTLIYEARVQHEHWAKHASSSNSPEVAANIYKDNHGGRSPPPHFDEWYAFAKGGVVIDEFRQIDEDLRPFWNLSPQVLRERADIMSRSHGVTHLRIKKGEVVHGGTDGDASAPELEALSAMIQKFSKFLPDMIIPINLSPSPRILPTWQEKQPPLSLEQRNALSSLLHPALAEHGEGAISSAIDETWSLLTGDNSVSAGEFRQMQTMACPPNAPTRTSPQWTVGQFCETCVKRHSRGALMSKWDRALDVCSQPDLNYLHGFSLANPSSPPIRQLMPLFGPSKTNAFSDILIPLPRTSEERPDTASQFDQRYDTMVWRGSVKQTSLSAHMLRGSHMFRLLHHISQPGPQDYITMILPLPGHKDVYGYEKISATDAGGLVPFTVGIHNYSACVGENCETLKKTFTAKEASLEPLEYRYVLLLDEDDGPSPDILRTIRSKSVPFISTIFRTWYTERLTAWHHFVPIDVRYQALHTIFSYFSGTEGRVKVNGRETGMAGRRKDAEWISEEGQKWADQALGPKEMEVYLFRLLLEWGRLIDDRRDDIGFRLDGEGRSVSDEWTSHGVS
ncbi:glycosyltransferase family 90 protein [Stachybotrys elegans]|uniref:Glycosyltransferase family 90 protein n=1 Tax=Stachybotrys elegans TaxID=80388 RepID=A0A8K0WTP6_9HYPO|nr:glycosyltransferase family 90 protein [Stachybotrys elegans]